ncbi:molybdate transport system substrate-binding protein [Granulicella aggregans]|uniref:Molybdate transport system substrate-binding protein n=1 Tax=Granulicella aggregans TaxID=474949 RepID=A0A7W7ZHT9_9BACT|nr:molybdate ABC transporter substrate-binding protein [Granulicella aggregans]MBB5059998.1 molybdate transport system substrate-binding protein [Granulicella aggregans]
MGQFRRKSVAQFVINFVALLLGAASFQAHAQAAKEIRVAAAADLQSALPPIAQRYEAKTGVKLMVSYGSSGTLATQILNGAPFDLFLGADYVFPEKIVAANLADSKDAIPYAKGALVLWARKDSPLQPLHLEALSDPRVQKIAIADELRAPYGRAAVAALTKLKLYDQLKPKLVVAENVAQASQFVQSGNAQLGLISLTTAMSTTFKEQGTYVLVPDVYPAIRQCAVIIAKSDRRTEAHAFLDWLLTTEIQAELPKLGLDPVR